MTRPVLCASLVLLLCSLSPAADDAPLTANPGAEQPPPAVVAHEVAWLKSLDHARELARTRRAPILVIFGATWCGPCHLLDEEIRKAEVQEQLQNWLPVHLDVDDNPHLAREMGVGSIPNLTVLTPDGNVVTSQVGAMSAPVLAAWLTSAFADARLEVLPQLLESGVPGLLDVSRIAREFRRRDSTLREAAINRLRPHPEAAATVVVTRFVRGNLSERLASRELLEGWGAPVLELDPWTPDSFTVERLAAIDQWLQAKSFEAAPGENRMTAQQTLEAERLVRAMLSADPAAAAALREQLARLGPDARTFLQEAFTGDLTDQEHSRLTAAKYRLACSPELVVNWPGGLERLASPRLEERIAAARELATLAGPRDEPLILELFSDPSPQIREISLKTLKATSGASTSSALMRLLGDADANVRVAVLKQLAENPTAALVPPVAEYLARETNPDLVVHAARLLREISSQSAIDALTSLFQHASWRVRSEAIEGVNKLMDGSRELAAVNRAELEQKYVQLLGDEDAFVISRALQGLESIGRTPSIEPIVALTATHPELAGEVVRVLTESSSLRSEAVEPLRKFLDHERPAVRAAALGGLAAIDEDAAAAPLRAGLRDPAAEVRLVAVDGVFRSLSTWISSRAALAGRAEEQNPAGSGGGIVTSLIRSFFGGSSAVPAPQANPPAEPEDDKEPGNAVDLMLLAIRENSTLPERLADLKDELTRLLSDENPEVRFAAARDLAVMGVPGSLRTLIDGATNREAVQKAAEALSLLPFQERLELYRKLIENSPGADDKVHVSHNFASQVHPETATELWTLLERHGGQPQLASGLVDQLLSTYFKENPYNPDQAPAAAKARCGKDCLRYVRSEVAAQRDVALAMLAQFDPSRAVEIAAPLYADENFPVAGRLSALQVLLACDEKANSEVRAGEALRSSEPKLLGPALSYLALGDAEITTLAGGISLRSYYSSWSSSSSSSDGAPLVFAPPAGVSADLLRPLLSQESPRPAQAGYLLALLEDPAGLTPLLEHWRKNPQNANYRRLTYRAIAKLNDSSQMGALEQIYAELVKEESATDIKDFYWTVRVMTGGPALALRQKIRDEHGADTLR